MSENFRLDELGEEHFSSESRFGDKGHTIEVMRSGEAHELKSIDELYPDEIAAHQNVVEVVQLFEQGFAERDPSNNKTEPVMLHFGKENPVLCVFKPFDGENTETKSHHGLASLYPREIAGYLVSEHFNLDLVPPTTIREVNGRIGALQLFMEPPRYLSGERYFTKSTDEEWELIQRSPDYQKMAVLDYIMANSDRKDANMLVRVDEHRQLSLSEANQPELIAIDHGLSLDSNTFKSVELMGPILGLTYDNLTRKPKKVELPDWLHTLLQKGENRREELDLTFLPDIPESQIKDLWQRTRNLVETRHFLSPENQILFAKN